MATQITQLDEDGFPEFEPVRIYDAPATLLTQIMDGEALLGRAIRTITNQESLSPTERDSYAQRLKQAYGGNAATNTIIDIGTNPLFWLLMVTSPIGRKEFAATGGKLLSGMAKMRQSGRVNKAAASIAQMLSIPGLTGLISSTETQAPAMILQTLSANMKKLREEEARFISTPRAALMQKLGVTDLDPTRSDNPVLQQLNRLLHYWESGHAEAGTVLNRRFVNTVVAKTQKVENGQLVGVAEPMILPRSVINELTDPTTRARLFNKGQRFKIGDTEYELATNAILVNDEKSLQAARSLFPKAKPGEKMGKYKDVVKYIHLEDDFDRGMHIVGLDKDAILSWARSNNIEREFLDYVTASSRMREHFKTRLFGKLNPDGSVPPTFTMDVDKVVRYYLRHQRSQGNPELIAERMAMQEIMGSDYFSAIDNALPAWVKTSLRSGSHRVKKSDVEDILTRFLSPQLESPYLPRNTSTVFKLDQNGRVVEEGPTAVDALSRRRNPGMSLEQIEGIVLPRERTKLLYNPSDLNVLAEVASTHGKVKGPLQIYEPGSTPESTPVDLGDFTAKMRNIIQNRLTPSNKRVAVLSMDHELSMRKYLRDAQATITLHATDLPTGLRGALLEAIRTPSPKFRGAYRDPSVKFDEEKIRKRLKFLGLTDEELKYMDPAASTLMEDLKANPALVRMRTEIETLRERLKLAKGKKAEAIKARMGKLGARLEKLSSEYEMPDVALLNPELDRRISIGEALNVVLRRESLTVQEQFNKHLLPHLYGGAKPADFLALTNNQNMRSMATKFANSGMGKWLEGSSEVGRDFIKGLRDYGGRTGYELDAAYRSGGLTGYLYATHLGFNAASAMWNAMQPLQWAATWMGGGEILAAYGTALKQLGSYTKERISKHGFGPMDPLARRELWQKHVRLAGRDTGGRDLLGLNDDIVSTLDAALISAPVGEKPSMLKYITTELPLKLFQKAEELNRIVVAEAGVRWYSRMNREAGVRMTPDELFDQVELMQSLVNFNPNPTTQLRMFQQGLMANPMMRMFLQYPLRSVSNLLVGQQLGGGTRRMGIGPVSFDAPAILADTSRILGMGAVTYEIGKNMLNLDLSSGLGGAALTQLPGQVVAAGVLPMPPVVDIPLKLIGSLAEQDREQFRQAAFRLVPGGLAIQKALGSLPALPGGGNFGIIQSQYADWGNRNEQGMVPVYDSNGMLQSFDSPLSLVMRGIGADFKKHQSPQEATKFLLANRAQMVDLRRKYKDAVLGNNMPAANAIEAEYRKRYGVPMTVKEGEWDRAISMRETSVSERMLDTMPAEVRGMYQQSLAGPAFAERMGLPPGSLAEGETAKQRESVRRFNVDIGALAGQNPE